MTSAFEPRQKEGNEQLESETEDEEVRMNCVGGFRCDDSDFESSDHFDEEEEFSCDDTEEDLNDGVVKFVTNHVPSRSEVPLVCPKASIRRLSPHKEDENEDESDTSSASLTQTTSNGEDCKSENTGNDEIEGEADDDQEDVGMNQQDDEQDFELTDILDSLDEVVEQNLDESESTYAYNVGIGVTEDRETDLATIPKTKRVLSYNTLTILNADAGNSSNNLKRARSNDLKDMFCAPSCLIPGFSLGPPAVQSVLPVQQFQIREESPVNSSDDEELDRQLGEELSVQENYQCRDETPVPLLTPPGSPLTIEVDGSRTTVCEWPSNLTVDSALQAINELRPLSPNSLENLERGEQGRVGAEEMEVRNLSTTLTPLLRGIQVGTQ